jgi:cytochrome c biogenesis protein CcdA
MKKVFTFLFTILFSVCDAATGNASDGQLFAIVIISLIILILGFGYFIDFMKNKIKEIRTRRLIRKNTADQDEEFLNSFIKPFTEIEKIPTY